MSFSDEEIIAFLLGDADDGLANRIRCCLVNDEDLADRISHFRCLLTHLDGTAQPFEPPVNLVEKTLAHIDSASLTHSSETEVRAFDQPTETCLASAIDVPSGSRSWIDSAVLTISLTVLCCLTIPAIVCARFESRRAQCAENLRVTGSSLFEFAIRRADRRFPFVASSGPESFSGVFVIRLNEAGLLTSGRLMPCASLNGIERPIHAPLAAVPTLEQLCLASDSQLECWKCTLGGDYAYNLGVFEEEQLVAPKNVGSSHFAILSDAPMFLDKTDQIVAHDGKGINILYDDGQVRFVNSQWLQSCESRLDNPFRNMLGAREAGIGRMDASLAQSISANCTLAFQYADPLRIMKPCILCP